MDKFISIGKNIKSAINSSEIKQISSQLSTYSDHQLRDKIIELCLMHDIECQDLIELPRDNCRKEILTVLQASI